MDTTGFTHQPLEVTTDRTVLKRKFHPQIMQIISEEFHEYMCRNNDDIFMNVQNIEWLYENIPDNLIGVLEYKDYTWDYFDAYTVGHYSIQDEDVAWYSKFNTWRCCLGKPLADDYDSDNMRCGMVAAISEKVVKIFEELGVSKDEYVIKPIRIANTEKQYYLLFVKTISEEDISLKDSDIRLDSAPGYKLSFETHKAKWDFINESDDHAICYKELAIAEKHKNRDLIFVQSDINYFFSNRLIEAFERHKVEGFEIQKYTNLKFV